MSGLHRYQCHLSIECGAKILAEKTMRARTGVQARPIFVWKQTPVFLYPLQLSGNRGNI